jgi:phosphotransferase system  glucose/maltose/N-acetylglucosamine-specific IIC component
MELNDLKSGWQNAGGAFKSQEDLQRMIKVTNHPSLKKIRTKLIAEIIGLTMFLFIYYDWFDGDQKPLYANLLLLAALLLYICNDVIGYISISIPTMNQNLRLSLQQYLTRIKRLSIFSLIITVLYSTAILIFFSPVIHFTKEKAFILLGCIVVLCQMILISYKTWGKWIRNLKQVISDFNLEGEK